MHPTDDSLPVSGDTAAFAALSFNPAEFAAYVADFDLSEAQQRELLETVWTMMVGFVDLGFRIHPVQQVLPEDDVKISLQVNTAPALESDHSTSTNTSILGDRFERVAGRTDS